MFNAILKEVRAYGIALVKNKQKALVAFAVAAASSLLAKHGSGFKDYVTYIQALVAGIVAHVLVYFTANK